MLVPPSVKGNMLETYGLRPMLTGEKPCGSFLLGHVACFRRRLINCLVTGLWIRHDGQYE
jgi:hypothetical protein